MLLHRTRRLTARRIKDDDGTEIIRIDVAFQWLHAARETLNAAEAATLGAVLLGFALTQPGIAQEYAGAVLRNSGLPLTPEQQLSLERLHAARPRIT